MTKDQTMAAYKETKSRNDVSANQSAITEVVREWLHFSNPRKDKTYHIGSPPYADLREVFFLFPPRLLDRVCLPSVIFFQHRFYF